MRIKGAGANAIGKNASERLGVTGTELTQGTGSGIPGICQILAPSSHPFLLLLLQRLKRHARAYRLLLAHIKEFGMEIARKL